MGRNLIVVINRFGAIDPSEQVERVHIVPTIVGYDISAA
jgi:hypothetical protein